ncbi:hypothetical protein [Tolypothrix sp. VBCCA 56010]|uniref:hypothetical protein n=1 Tax=Tolypothrix sp. VBCCA 56010 TaxID=3137731 RepID=UPI003D7D20DC
MSNLSRNLKAGSPTDLVLKSLQVNTASTLIAALISEDEPKTIDAKIEILSQLMQCAEELECNLENKTTFLHWTAIASGFATAAVICGTAALNPIAGFLVAATSASAGVVTVSGSLFHNKEAAKIIEKLKRLQLAIKSDALINWACLWGLAGFDLFCTSLQEAGTGTLSEFELIKKGKVSPLTAAVKLVAQSRGVEVAVVVKQLGEIKSRALKQLEENIVQKTKAVLQPTYAKPQPRIDTPGEHAHVPTTPEAVDKFQWIDQVLKMPFRVLTGDAGSGKSTLERFMISKLKEAGYHIVCLNTETNPDVWKGVEVLTTSDEINDFLSDFVAGIENRQRECRKLGIDEDEFLAKVAAKKAGRDGRVAIFFMEANTFELCGVDADLWASVLQMCLTNIRKWGYTACLTAQSDNQTSISSKMKGFSSRYDEQPRVECIVKTDDVTGEAVSSGRAWLKVKGKADKNPKSINLANFPKTKDFRTQAEKDAPVDTTMPIPKHAPKSERKLSDIINSLEKSLEISDKDSEGGIMKPQESTTDTEIDLTDTAYLIDEWLEVNRPEKWVKFKGKKNRDSSFVNFLSASNIKGESKDEAIAELLSAKKIELSEDGTALRWLKV